MLSDKIGFCPSIVFNSDCMFILVLLYLGFDFILQMIEQDTVETSAILLTIIFVVGAVPLFSGFPKHRKYYMPVSFIIWLVLSTSGASIFCPWVTLFVFMLGVLLIEVSYLKNLKKKNYAVAG